MYLTAEQTKRIGIKGVCNSDKCWEEFLAFVWTICRCEFIIKQFCVCDCLYFR